MPDLPDDLSPRAISRISTSRRWRTRCGSRSSRASSPPARGCPRSPSRTRSQVSRNTLREAFRLLGREGLVDHLPHRGGFVAQLEEARHPRPLPHPPHPRRSPGRARWATASERARELLRRQLTLLEDAAPARHLARLGGPRPGLPRPRRRAAGEPARGRLLRDHRRAAALRHRDHERRRREVRAPRRAHRRVSTPASWRPSRPSDVPASPSASSTSTRTRARSGW